MERGSHPRSHLTIGSVSAGTDNKHCSPTDERARCLKVRYAVLSVRFTSCRDTLRESQTESAEVAYIEQMVNGSDVQRVGAQCIIMELGGGDSVFAGPAVV